MRAAVVYESMYGNTHAVASAIAEGLAATLDIELIPITKLEADSLAGVSLLVLGGPTHAHSMSRASSREAAFVTAAKDDNDLVMDTDADGTGIREWLSTSPFLPHITATFDTRVNAPRFITGQASARIAKRLVELGCKMVTEPESFLVTKDNVLVNGELERARAWGRLLGSLAPTT